MVGRTKRASFKGIHGSLVGYKSCPDPELAGLEYIFALVMDQTIKDYIAARKIRYQYEFGDEKDQMRLQRKKKLQTVFTTRSRRSFIRITSEISTKRTERSCGDTWKTHRRGRWNEILVNAAHLLICRRLK